MRDLTPGEAAALMHNERQRRARAQSDPATEQLEHQRRLVKLYRGALKAITRERLTRNKLRVLAVSALEHGRRHGDVGQ